MVKAVIDAIDAAIVVFDGKGTIHHINDGAVRLFGHRVEEVCGRAVDELIPGVGGDSCMGRKKVDCVSKGGSHFTADFTVGVINADGETLLIGTVRPADGPELSEREFRMVLDELLDTYYRTDREGRIEVISRSIHDVLGYHPQELAGTHIADLYADPDGRETFMADLADAGGRLTGYDLHLMHKDGRAVWISTSSRFRRDGAGEVIGVEGVFRDVTESRRQQENLRMTAAGVTGSVGEEFFPWLVRHLAETSGAAFAFIGEATGPAQDRIRTIAVHAHGKPAANFEYELDGTPCENVVGKAPCVYGRNVQNLFPRDRLLVEFGVEGYVGLPLFDSQRQAIGILVVIDTRPINRVEDVLTYLRIFAARAAAEIERKRIVEALTESEARHSEAQSIAHVGHWEWDTETGRTWRSEEYARIIGRAREDTFGAYDKAVDNIVHPDDRARVHSVRVAMFEKDEPYDVEFRIIRPDGALRHVHSRAKIVRGEDGKLVRFHGVTQDITERKLIEEALRESEERHADAQRMAHIGHWEWDLTSGMGRWSDEFARIIGRPPEGGFANFSEAVSNVVHPDDRRFVLGARNALIDNGRPYDVEFRIVHPEYGIRYVHSRAEVVRDADGKALRLLGTTQDITERKTMEVALVGAKEQAESANRVKTEFLATMSHELRTPLNSIIGFSEILASETFGPLGSTKYREYARDVNQSGRQLHGLIGDILDVSQIEMGHLDLSETDVEVGRLVASCIRLVDERAARRGVDLSVDLATDLPRLHMDELRGKQILLNLLTNAVKFTPTGGRVTLAVALDDERGMRFTIADTGIGIEPRDIDKVMSMFGQADGIMNRRHDGVGLGLPLARRLAELHDGTLELTSTPNVGTTVTVRFPATRVVG